MKNLKHIINSQPKELVEGRFHIYVRKKARLPVYNHVMFPVWRPTWRAIVAEIAAQLEEELT